MSKNQRRQLIAVRDFTDTPGGGPRGEPEKKSGQEWLEDHLMPMLLANPQAKVIIDLDGTCGYPPSFLQYVFEQLTFLELRDKDWTERIGLLSKEEPYLIQKITDIIEQAKTKWPKPPKENHLRPVPGYR